MTLSEWLYFLDTNGRVQCPEITAQQAAELAALLRLLKSQLDGKMELAEMLNEQRYQREKERDEARAEVKRFEDGRNAKHPAQIAAMKNCENGAHAEPVNGMCPNCGGHWAGLHLCSECGRVSDRFDPDRQCRLCSIKKVNESRVVPAAPDFDADDYAKPGKVKP